MKDLGEGTTGWPNPIPRIVKLWYTEIVLPFPSIQLPQKLKLIELLFNWTLLGLQGTLPGRHNGKLATPQAECLGGRVGVCTKGCSKRDNNYPFVTMQNTVPFKSQSKENGWV